ncbi:hypothetical protein EV424DRAFT_1348757 [Suillus variegatus]|nr:hypothetical protein EV424DRAFT_1348757 [Suillus variegatus]
MSDRDFASDPRLIVIRSFDVNMSAAEVDEPKKWFFILTDVLRARAEVKIRPGIGGLIGIRTKIDPTLCRADRLVGQVLGAIVQLTSRACTEAGEEVVLLRRIEKHWRVVGRFGTSLIMM